MTRDGDHDLQRVVFHGTRPAAAEGIGRALRVAYLQAQPAGLPCEIRRCLDQLR